MIRIDAHDLTAYVKAERGGPLLTILDEVRDFVFIKDLDSRFLFSNRAHLAHLGLTEAEVIGKNDFELFPPRLAEVFFAAETHLFETQSPVIRLQESVDSIGKKFYSTAIKMLICDKRDIALGLIGSIHRIPADDAWDMEKSKAHIMSILRHQPGVTLTQLKAFEASLPSVLANP